MTSPLAPERGDEEREGHGNEENRRRQWRESGLKREKRVGILSTARLLWEDGL